MHLGSADRQGRRKIPRQPAQIMVAQPRFGHDQRRFRGRFSPEAAAAIVYRAAGLGLVAGLSVPCAAGADAPAPDRHRAIQVRRVQTERADRAGPQSRLLEAGTPLSRRHRVYDHQKPVDLDPGTWRQEIRPHRPRFYRPGADEGNQGRGARDGVPDRQLEHQPQPDHQPQCAAIRQSGAAQGNSARARPQASSSTSSARATAISARRCSRRPKACGACRRR